MTHESAIQGTDPSQHSPWELFNAGATPEQMRAEAPSLDSAECARLQAAVEQLMRMRKYQLFCDTPGPEAVYATGDEGAPALVQMPWGSMTPLLQLPMWQHHCVNMLGEGDGAGTRMGKGIDMPLAETLSLSQCPQTFPRLQCNIA